MNKGNIIVAGIGPGSEADITPAVLAAIQSSDVIIGYKYYFRFITHLLREGTECIDTGMKREQARAEQAFAYANEGKTVCVISSGDAGIYGMTPLIYEMKKESGSEIEIESYPGISAFQKAASLLGAPIGHDFCVISLSDLMTPWELIEKRIHAAAMADFVTAIYNPKSEGRYWQLYRLKELFLQERKPETPVGYVRQAGGARSIRHYARRSGPRADRYVYGSLDRKLTNISFRESYDHSPGILWRDQTKENGYGYRTGHHDP